MGHGNEEGYCDFAQEFEDLEREVGRSKACRDEEGINDVGQCCWEVRSSHHVDFDSEEARHDQVAPELARLHLPKDREQHEREAGSEVVDADVLYAGHDVGADCCWVAAMPG